MNKRLIVVVCCFAIMHLSKANTVLRIQEPLNADQQPVNQAFKEGETLKFRLHYGIINAGLAELKVESTSITIHDKKMHKLVAKGRSVAAFDPFYKVRDVYESYIDQRTLTPWLFFRDCYEGGYVIKQQATFNPQNNTVKSNTKTIATPEMVCDILSVFYYARAQNYTNAKIGDTFSVPTWLDDEVFPMKFKFVGRQVIRTDIGYVRCMKFLPVLLQGRVFKHEEDMVIYVSDDENKIPVEVKANILVGAIKMTITDYEGLRNPFSALIKKK